MEEVGHLTDLFLYTAKILKTKYFRFIMTRKDVIKIIFCAAIFSGIQWQTAYSQIIRAIPVFPTQEDSVRIIYDAAEGSKGLMGYNGDVYAHTGVITSESTSGSDWKYAPQWGDNSEKYKLTRIEDDLYELKITPSIHEFYGVGDDEKVERLAFVFRSADNSKEGKTETLGDIFYDVYEKGLKLNILTPAARPALVELNDTIFLDAFTGEADSVFLYENSVLLKAKPGNDIQDTIVINETGKSWLKVMAKNDTATVSDSLYYYVRSATPVAEMPANLNEGITYMNDSTVGLVLFAPFKEYVFAIGDFSHWELDDAYQMNQTPDGNYYWINIENVVPGKEYIFQYLVDGGIRIGDPYAEKVSDPWNDKWIDDETYPNLIPYPEGKTSGIATVFQTRQDSYEWKVTDFTPPANEDLVIYELLVRDFHEKHSYQAIIDSLNYLKSLGINAIELMPVNEFEGNISWGYNPSYYFAPDKYYGTKNDLKRLIDTLHAEGMAVILDIVLNHSFGQSPMVQLYWDAENSRPAENNPWYNQVPKHDFNVGYDFNHESIHTKRFAARVVKHWVEEYKIDGYRFDLSKGLTQTNTLGDAGKMAQYDPTRIKIINDIGDTIRQVNPDAILILEHFADNTEEQELVNDGFLIWGNSNYNYLRAAMGWNYDNKSNFSWGSYKTRGFSSPNLITYMESHDEERMLEEVLDWGNHNNPNYIIRNNLDLSLIRAELATAFFFTIPGPKMIWMFGEIGYDYSINFNGRTGPKPIKWDYFNNPNRRRLYEAYSSLIQLKLNEPAFGSDNYTIDVADTIKTIHIEHDDMDVTVVGNFDSREKLAYPGFAQTGTWYDYFSGDSLLVEDKNVPVMLDKSEYRIYTTRKLEQPDIIAAPKARNIQIEGEIEAGSTLTGSYDYFDINGDPEGKSKYQWYLGTKPDGSDKQPMEGDTNKTFTLTELYTNYVVFFEVTAVAQSGFLKEGEPEIATYNESKGTFINQLSGERKPVRVYPNPSRRLVHFNVAERWVRPASLRIYNLLGEVVYEERHGNAFTWENKQNMKGIFIYEIKSGQSGFTGKFIVK